MKIKETSKIALIIAIFLTVISFFIYFLLALFNNRIVSFVFYFIFMFGVSFLVIKNKFEQIILKKIKKVYNDVSELNSNQIDKMNITSNIESLSKNVKQFAEDKQLEIEHLKEKENYRREFLGNISHELKTPLFTVQGYILTLLEGAVEDKNIRLKYLERANNGVERLNHIVKDLDMISKLEMGGLALDYTKFNIILLIKTVFDLLDIESAKHHVTLNLDKIYESPVYVSADKNRIQQVLINLIANAIYYGKEHVITSVKYFSKDQIIISVYDDGDGIPNELLPRLFERFYRVDKSRARNRGGSGLGLSIVKHIIEAHNEQVLVESEIGKGSTFSFTLKINSVN